MDDEFTQIKLNYQNMMAGVGSEVANYIRCQYPSTVKDHCSTMLKEFSIVICGAPRIGKSELINAIVGKDVATTSADLNSCTKRITSYPMVDQADTSFQTCIYDTPGFEEWNDSITDVLTKTTPIALIFCMSPKSWTPTEKMKLILRECFKLKILVALVCTNMWTGEKDCYKKILGVFDNLITELLHEQNCIFVKNEANGVTYFRVKKEGLNTKETQQTMVLYTAVNSKVYINKNVRREPSGVVELIDAITASLDSVQVTAWFFAVLNNKGYWTQMREDAFRAIKERIAIFGGGAITAFNSFTSWFRGSKS